MESVPGEPTPDCPMIARSALAYLLRTHDGATHGDPDTLPETAEGHLRAEPDDAEVRDSYESWRVRHRGRPAT
jgi:hypothetical protein